VIFVRFIDWIFGSICKFKLGVNKYFSWSLLYTIIAIYFNIYISKTMAKL